MADPRSHTIYRYTFEDFIVWPKLLFVHAKSFHYGRPNGVGCIKIGTLVLDMLMIGDPSPRADVIQDDLRDWNRTAAEQTLFLFDVINCWPSRK